MRIVRRSRSDVDLSKVDWDRIARTTDADVTVHIATDADTAPVFTASELIHARRVVPARSAADVKALRNRLGLSQSEFAARYGFSIETIRNYEQGHRRPAGPARTLLEVIANEPDLVTRALARRKGRAR